MTNNPFTAANNQSEQSARQSQLQLAKVTNVEAHQSGDENKHVVECEPVGSDGSTVTAPMTVPQKGDVHPPTVGSHIVLAQFQSQRPIVLGAVYFREDTVPSYSPGERVVGHPTSDAHVRLDENGDIHAENDSGTKVVVSGNDIQVRANSGKVYLGDEGASTKAVARDGDDVYDGSGNFVGNVSASSNDVESS